jgi:hypothetical protein
MFSSAEFLDFTHRALERVRTISQIGFVIRQMAREASLTHNAPAWVNLGLRLWRRVRRSPSGGC